MKKLLAFGVLFASSASIAQYELSSFTTTGRGGATTFVTDYQAIGINPANLGWTAEFEEKKIAMGFSEMSYSLHSEALSKQELRDQFKAMRPTWLGGDGGASDPFTYEEKLQAAQSFADAGLAMNIDLGSFGFAFTTEKFGGFGFRINDHFQWYSQLGPTASDLLFLGKTSSYFDSLTVVNDLGGGNYDTTVIANDPSVVQGYDQEDILNGFSAIPQMIGEVLTDTRMSMMWYREYNFSYGKKIFEKDSVFALYGGFGIKYLQGIGILDIQAPGGELDAFAALSPVFGIDYGAAGAANPSSISGSGFPPKSVGSGWGYDFGVNAVLFNKLKLGLAVTNAGSITWDGNVYSIRDTLVTSTESAGLQSYNVFNSLDDLAGDDGLLAWDGETERKVALPSMIRLGASIKLGKMLEVGVDIITPGNRVPGNLEKSVIGFGGDFKPLPFLKLQAGVMTGGNYGTQVPLGIMLMAPSGAYEFGIASRDAVSFFVKNGPTLSLSLGFARMRF